ncbi:hypothetical protein NEUTE1DRAFT_131775 [Neurospora tetrasperma FGSC 2508]|uniref:Uncharacterized protein n=1 Tax=Neurospora tetrasperma (strain FGSC 2508 / ATCC MYA-4615 / P0657) TaxID=510951 RepID=F8MWN9_NEUT8
MVPARINDEYVAGMWRKADSVSLTYATPNPTGDILPGGRRHLRDIFMPVKLIYTTTHSRMSTGTLSSKASSSSVASRYVEHSTEGAGILRGQVSDHAQRI